MSRTVQLLLAITTLGVAGTTSASGRSDAPQLQQSIADRLIDLEWPAAIYLTGAGIECPHGAARGYADAERQVPLTVETPLRIASNTKPFTAATVLRLSEQGVIDLDAAIAPLIARELNSLLLADGYDTNKITVRQLLSHSAGLYDHGGDSRFSEALFSSPDRQWTREDLVRLSTALGDPQSEPGTEFRYSDTGYVLLGDIVERVTGLSLAAAVRRELHLDRLGLKSTWWEIMETPPEGVEARARQFIGNREATQIHASMDLYGGGGLLMSARDLAVLTAALFEGRIFEKKATLEEMLKAGSHDGGDTYRLGIFVKELNGHVLYWHSGFWGTIVYYSPLRRVAVAGVTTNQDGFSTLTEFVETVVANDILSDTLCTKSITE